MEISRVEGVVGGYIVTDGKATLSHFKILASDPAYVGHERHNTSVIVHAPGDMGVADPLSLNGTIGWKCSDCTPHSTRKVEIVNEENVNPHFKRPEEFGLEVK